MAELIVKDEECVGCGECVDACPYNAIEIVNDKAVVKQNCTACGACVEACPNECLEVTGVEKDIKDLSAYKDVWVFAEQREGALSKVAIQLLGCATGLAKELAAHTGLDRATAEASLQQVLNALGGQLGAGK